jgi:hypothetical protein
LGGFMKYEETKKLLLAFSGFGKYQLISEIVTFFTSAGFFQS